MIFLGVVLGVIAHFFFWTIREDYKKFKTSTAINGQIDKTKLKQFYSGDTLKGTILCIVIGSAFTIGCLACLSSSFSSNSTSPKSNSSGIKGRPWEDLGTSQKEYMDAYKYQKSHGTK